jgi:hypothetical protein
MCRCANPRPVSVDSAIFGFVILPEGMDRVSLAEGIEPALQPIHDEVRRLEESAMYSAQGQFERAKFWRGLNISLGLAAALFAAVSGVAGLASDSTRILSGVLALIAAGIVSVLTTVNADRRHSQAAAAGDAYLSVQTSARQLAAVDLAHLDYDRARSSSRSGKSSCGRSTTA